MKRVSPEMSVRPVSFIGPHPWVSPVINGWCREPVVIISLQYIPLATIWRQLPDIDSGQSVSSDDSSLQRSYPSNYYVRRRNQGDRREGFEGTHKIRIWIFQDLTNSPSNYTMGTRQKCRYEVIPWLPGRSRIYRNGELIWLLTSGQTYVTCKSGSGVLSVLRISLQTV